MNPPANRCRGALPKIGIQPTIDGRLSGVRNSLEAVNMGMAKAAVKLIGENLMHPNGASMASRFGRKSILVFAVSIPTLPYICPKCQGTMTVVAIIEDPAVLTKIIEWAKKQEPQPSVCARSPPEPALVPK